MPSNKRDSPKFIWTLRRRTGPRSLCWHLGSGAFRVQAEEKSLLWVPLWPSKLLTKKKKKYTSEKLRIMFYSADAKDLSSQIAGRHSSEEVREEPGDKGVSVKQDKK